MNVQEYKQDHINLLSGIIKPSKIVGRGYKSPKSVASAWLLKQIHNAENPQSKVSGLMVMTNGKPFSSEAKAMASKGYKALIDGTIQLLADNTYVSDYGVMPSPCCSGGYVGYFAVGYHKQCKV
jgi:hypothetical protein